MARRYINRYYDRYAEGYATPAGGGGEDQSIFSTLGLVTVYFMVLLFGPIIHRHIMALLPVIPDPTWSGIMVFFDTIAGVCWWIFALSGGALLVFPIYYTFLKRRSP